MGECGRGRVKGGEVGEGELSAREGKRRRIRSGEEGSGGRGRVFGMPS